MRVVVIADRFGPGPELSARAVANDICAGWLVTASHDSVEAVALSDGSAGFVDALADVVTHSEPVVIRGPFRDGPADTGPVPAQIGLVGASAYIEAAHVLGRHLGSADVTVSDVLNASSAGLGDLMTAARATGARRIVVGVGLDLVCHDGGRGLLVALGAGEQFENLRDVCAEWADVSLVLATASQMPLTGFHGASAALTSERGVPAEVSQGYESLMGRFTERVDTALGGPASPDLLTGAPRRRERVPGAGVGGGVGYALQILGARTAPGSAFLLEELDVMSRLMGSLVVIATPTYDWHCVAEGVVADAAKAALAAATPTVLLAHEVLVGRREGMSLGISGSYAARPGESMRELGARVARTWSPPPRSS